jgi:hypothetical protein
MSLVVLVGQSDVRWEKTHLSQALQIGTKGRFLSFTLHAAKTGSKA